MQTLLLDVDYTLYPRNTGPFALVNNRIEQFVMEKLGLDQKNTQTLRRQYIQTYGSTLGGLMHDYAQDPQAFLAYVHDVPIESMLTHDARLAGVLAAVRLPLVAFSNGSKPYVRRILAALGISGFFETMFTIEDMEFMPKPGLKAYHNIMKIQGKNPQEYILVDDMQDNVRTARELGMHAILVGLNSSEKGPMISDIYELPQALASLHNRA